MVSDPRPRTLGDPELEEFLDLADVARGAVLVARDVLLVCVGLIALALVTATTLGMIAAPFLVAENSEQI